MLLIVLVLSCVLVAILIQAFAPMALTVLLTVIELSAVRVTIAPVVLAKAFGFAPLVLAHVAVSILKLVLALPMP